MRLRVIGTLDDPRVVNEAGEELQGVTDVQIRAGGHKVLRKVAITLDHVAIDLAFDASRAGAVMLEDGKYAHSKLLDVARLRWLRR